MNVKLTAITAPRKEATSPTTSSDRSWEAVPTPDLDWLLEEYLPHKGGPLIVQQRAACPPCCPARTTVQSGGLAGTLQQMVNP